MARLPSAEELGERPIPRPFTGRLPAQDSEDRGVAIQQVGRNLMQAGEDLYRAQDEADTLRAEEAHNKLIEQTLELSAGPEGFRNQKGSAAVNRPLVQDYTGKFDLAAKSITEGLRNDRQREKFRRRAELTSQQFRADLLRHYAQEGEVYAKEVYDSSLTLEAKNVGAHWNQPGAVASSLARVDSLVQREGLRDNWSPERLQVERMRALSGIQTSVIARALDANNLGYAQQYFKSVRDTMDPESASRVQNALEGKQREMEQEARIQRALARADLTERGQDQEAAAKAGLPIQEHLTRKEFLAAFENPDEAERRYQRHALAVSAGSALQEGALADPAKQREILARFTPAGTEGAAEMLQQRKFIAEGFAEMNKARENDPAAYAIRYLPSVEQAFTALQTAPPELQGDAAETYVRQVQAFRADLGIQNRAVLPADVADSIAIRLNEQPAGQTSADAVAAESARWGRAWPLVWKQIAPNVSDGVFNVASFAGRSSPADNRNVAALLDRGYALTAGTDDKPASFKLKAGADGKTGLEKAFNTFVGNAFIGDAAGRQRALSGVTAAYAAYAENRPDGLTGAFDDSTFKLAAQAYFGTKERRALRINGGTVFAPYGMDEDTFTSGLFADAQAKLKGVQTPEQIDALVNNAAPRKFGDGYILITGDSYVPDQNGEPMIFRPIEVPAEQRVRRASPFDPYSPLVQSR